MTFTGALANPKRTRGPAGCAPPGDVRHLLDVDHLRTALKSALLILQRRAGKLDLYPLLSGRVACRHRHSSTRFRSWALIATTTVLADIRTAPTAGVRRMFHAESAPAARGIATML